MLDVADSATCEKRDISIPAGLPASGAVLGIDVGFSPSSLTTAFCLLAWDDDTVRLEFSKARSDAASRVRAVRTLLDRVKPSVEGEQPALTVAIDGPLTHGLALVERYRVAEALFSQGVFQKRGKPGQTNSPTGRQLHEHATWLARMVLDLESRGYLRIGPARHHEPIHSRAVVEAFPNQFLAALVPECSLPKLRRDAIGSVLGGLSRARTVRCTTGLPRS